MEYKIVYSARKTLAIKVSGGQVTVWAPKIAQNNGRYDKKIADFITQKQDWIEKTVIKQTAYKSNLLPEITDFTRFYRDGREIQTEYSDKIARISLKEDKIIIPRALTTNLDALKAALKKSYKKLAVKELKLRLEKLSRDTGLPYAAFRLSDAGTRWGSCTSQKHVMLNWRLILLSYELRDYVIIHELCHTVYLNHSAVFWRTVEKFCPDYRNLKAALKSYGFLTEYLR